MTQTVRQSTQVVVRIGPFVDVTDGFTPETGVTLSGADEAELLKAAGAATVDISAATWAAITGADGWYNLTLTASHTDTVGTLDVVVNDDSVCLPVFARFQVIEEAAYDSFYAASADPKADINVASIDANAITAASMAADASAEIADAVWDEDATGHQTGGTFGQAIGDPGADTNTIFKAVVTDATGATVGVDVAAVLDDTGTAGVVVASLNANVITAAATAADFTTEIQSGLATAAALDTVDNFLDTEIAAILAAVDTEVAAIKAVTDLLPDAGALTSLATQASVNTIDDFLDTEIAAILAAVDTEVGAIKTQTDKLTFTVANQLDANVQSINDVTITGNGAATPFNVV